MSQTSNSLPKNDEERKLEWMYKGPSDLLNREDYLLGRAIDKNFEQLEAQEKEDAEKKLIGVTVSKNHVEHECIPFSIRAYRNNQNGEQVDLQRKILEDPLMAIKQKEMESRRKILENPVKLKELHRLLKSEQKGKFRGKKMKKEKKSKKSKKDKKSKKKRKRSSSSSSSSSDKDLDELLAKKYKKLQDKISRGDNTITGLDLNKLLNTKYDKLTKELDKSSRNKKCERRSSEDRSSESSESRHKKNVDRRRENRKHRTSPYSSASNHRNPFKNASTTRKEYEEEHYSEKYRKPGNSYDYGGNRKKEYTDNTKYSEDRQSKRDTRGTSSEDDSRYKKKNYGLVNASGEKVEINKSSERHKISKETQQSFKSKYTRPEREKLTKEEKERRLMEMKQNAEWRNVERERNVKKYRDEYKSENKKYEEAQFDKTFINKELHKAMTSQKSVESRIKSNINNIQRSGGAMDKNFARR